MVRSYIINYAVDDPIYLIHNMRNLKGRNYNISRIKKYNIIRHLKTRRFNKNKYKKLIFCMIDPSFFKKGA